MLFGHYTAYLTDCECLIILKNLLNIYFIFLKCPAIAISNLTAKRTLAFYCLGNAHMFLFCVQNGVEVPSDI